MLKQSENIVHRLFTRQISRTRPNTHIHQARKLYENIVPSHTIYDVECPDHSFRKFTNDGQYLICFSRNHQDLIVYRHKWLNFCVKGDASDKKLDLPAKSKKFDSYFTQLYTIPLASGTEVICKDFFLSTENGLYGLFASSTAPDNSNPSSDGAVRGVPSTEKITISLVSLAEGRITDQRFFHNDFIHLAHNMGVFLYDDLLAVLSVRFQRIQILQIRETGKFLDVRTIGTHCREDDELVLNSQAQEEESYHKQQASKAGLLSTLDASVSGKLPKMQENAWPPLWNTEQGQSIRREKRNRQSRPGNASMGDVEPTADSHHEDVQNADLDLQYDHYFSGLFATLENRAVSQMNSVLASDSGRSAANGEGSISGIRREIGVQVSHQAAPGIGQYTGEDERWAANSQQATVGYGYFSGERTGAQLQVSRGNGQMTAIQELRTAYAPFDLPYNYSPAGRYLDGSTSGSGGYYSSAGPSRYGRSYTSTRGSSLDRNTSGRGSSSVRYTNTTITSSDSESRSEGSRHDVGVSGGRMSYDSGRVRNGTVSVQTENGSIVEYVVSRRANIGTEITQEIVPDEPSLPSRSREGIDRRSSGGNFMEDGQSLPGNSGTSVVNEHFLEDHWAIGGTDELNLNHRALPSRPGERSNSVNDRAVVQTGTGRRAQVSLREGHNGNRARPAREGENGRGGAHQRSNPAVDVAASDGERGQVLGGIKQRLLSYIFQGVLNDCTSPTAKAQRLKRFYYHFQHYVDLVMWKVQFLDRYHLLIKFGSVDGVLQRNSDTSHQTAFLAIFNLETTEMLGFYQNSSEEFLLSFEQFCDHFRVAPRYPLYMNFTSSYSNNYHVREQLRKQRMASSSSKAGTYLQVVKRTLAWVPFNSQCQSPSAYFDQSLFHYDEKLISAIDRHKPCVEHPIKFISRRRPNSLKFKINPGPEFGTNDGRTKRVASFIFHPIFPFAVSIQQSFMQPSVVNFHFRK